jgi:23S rRNA U2552 (ribose-2'-O)-methylase RlmE/FtsJ
MSKSIYHNYKEYGELISEKYNKTKDIYNNVFTNENPELFLYYYDLLNVFPIYPRPIIMSLIKPDEQFKDIETIDLEKMQELNEKLSKKIDEFGSYYEDIGKLRNEDKIRRFFSYEIIDKLKDSFPESKITNAWLKMTELLHSYKFIKDKEEKVESFHICEHPGAFVYAMKDYYGEKLDFVFESLKPNNSKQIFEPDPELVRKYKNKLDYGAKNTGDITDKENIKYYINTYKNRKFNLITSDCGLDFSDDFKKQESGLYKLFLCALITAIGLGGENYIFKLFSFNTKQTIDLLYLACQYYEQVDLVRLLTDKSGSGEIYCVCLNLRKEKNRDIEDLLKYVDNLDFNKYDEKFINRIENHHKLLTMRRIVNYNQLIFRFLNNKYIDDNPETKLYVKNLADYYVDYFIKSFVKEKEEKNYEVEDVQKEYDIIDDQFIKSLNEDKILENYKYLGYIYNIKGDKHNKQYGGSNLQIKLKKILEESKEKTFIYERLFYSKLRNNLIKKINIDLLLKKLKIDLFNEVCIGNCKNRKLYYKTNNEDIYLNIKFFYKSYFQHSKIIKKEILNACEKTKNNLIVSLQSIFEIKDIYDSFIHICNNFLYVDIIIPSFFGYHTGDIIIFAKNKKKNNLKINENNILKSIVKLNSIIQNNYKILLGILYLNDNSNKIIFDKFINYSLSATNFFVL